MTEIQRGSEADKQEVLDRVEVPEGLTKEDAIFGAKSQCKECELYSFAVVWRDGRLSETLVCNHIDEGLVAAQAGLTFLHSPATSLALVTQGIAGVGDGDPDIREVVEKVDAFLTEYEESLDDD